MRRFLDLHFSMPCPYVFSDTEQECGTTIRVRAWPGSPATPEYPGDPPGWEAWGCPHIEYMHAKDSVASKTTEMMQDRIEQKIEEKEADAQARAEEARIARAEEER